MTIENESSNNTVKNTKTIPAANARMFARLFNIGNLLSLAPGLILAPIILLTEQERLTTIFMFIAMIVPPILWFGLSIMIYIIARHHPNELVGHYTQQAAYRYYGMIGVVIPVGTFFGTEWELWILMGGVVGLVLIPWTIWELIKSQKESWQDIEIMIDQTSGETS
ncbi:MAG: hypothetical protein IMF04_04025 [Proteobacteria bacterium]|nr:hypothetical protein [Pseudomonadota bacterium]